MTGDYRCRDLAAAFLLLALRAGLVLVCSATLLFAANQSSLPVEKNPQLSSQAASRLQVWASTWSQQQVGQYLEFYSEQFRPVDGMPLDEWKKLRVSRIQKASQLSVRVQKIVLLVATPEEMVVEFVQHYRSELHQDVVRKEIVFVQVQGQWLVRSERALQVLETTQHKAEATPELSTWEQAQGQFRTYGLTDTSGEWGEDEDASPLNLKGFWEVRLGSRFQSDPEQKRFSIAETRLQLELEKDWEDATTNLVADILYDPLLNEHAVHLEEGRGWIDLREANVSFSPLDSVDEKVGRQILTWGTGDLLFINDLFPKDWKAFFLGRDVAYLKAPSDAFKVSGFHDFANVDFVYTPRFDPDRYIDGRRISFFDPTVGQRTGRDDVVNANQPDAWFKDDEIALRIYRNIKGYELAAYGYDGFWKSPAGIDPGNGEVTFPALTVVGASARGVLADGLINIEVGYYDSRDDSSGNDVFIRNSEFRLLLGFEREIAKELTAGVQYYLEHMQDHDKYLASLPAGSFAVDEDRSVFTLRLNQFLLHQNLQLSLFTYYSPSDRDGYVRPKVKYKVDDSWAVEAGANVFFGEHEHTFFGQLEKNSNVYSSVRFGF